MADTFPSYPAATNGVGKALFMKLSGVGVTNANPETPSGTLVGGNNTYKVTLSVAHSASAGVSATVAVTANLFDLAGTFQPIGSFSSSKSLLSSANYAILAAAGITNTGATVVTGGVIGSSPTTTITGFPPGVATIDNAHAAQAQTDALVAYNAFSALSFTSLSGSTANLSVLGNGSTAATYLPGNYSAGSSMDIPTSITLDAQGNPNAQFVFKAGSTITLESGASVLLVNGAQAANVIWLVGSSFTSVAPSTMVGNIMANTSITLGGGVLNGRALAGIVTVSGAVTISTATAITVPVSGGSGTITALSYNFLPTAFSGSQQSYPVPNAQVGAVASVGPVSITSSAGVATITPLNPGQAVVEFEYPFASNSEGLTGGSLQQQNDMVYAQILVQVVP